MSEIESPKATIGIDSLMMSVCLLVTFFIPAKRLKRLIYPFGD